uniref:hypothetical protein n=1 Tax=Lentilactobacillus hilgardii TaxID=1588 RepID=UPI00403F12CD
MNSFEQAEKAIDQILHNSLYTYKVKHSNFTAAEPVTAQKHHGTVFLCFSKASLEHGRGFLYTSKEALHEVCWGGTHWTPNSMRYGTYGGTQTRQFFLHAGLDNVLQVNTFVVDCDWHDQLKPELSPAFIAQLTINDRLKPTLILNTPHGYQIYYVLGQPAYVKRHKNGRLPVVDVAQKIAANLKRVLGQRIPQVDQGCNNFGFFRLPRPDNIWYYHPEQTSNFADWIEWSQAQTRQQKVVVQYHAKHYQWTPAWYRAALKVTTVPEGGCNGGLGRHNFALTAALGAKGSGQGYAQTLSELRAWNDHNGDPLPAKELKRIVKDAFSGPYHGATTPYILRLRHAYLAGQMLSADRRYWHKWAKPRARRQYSHLTERARDLLAYLKRHINPRTGYLEKSWRAMEAALQLSHQALNRLIQTLVAQGQLQYQTSGRGCRARTHWRLVFSHALRYQKHRRQQLLHQLHWTLAPDKSQIMGPLFAVSTTPAGKPLGLAKHAGEIPE